MKWIQDTPNRYKLVEDDDPRPEVQLKDKNGMPFVKYTPSWKAYEQNYWTPDPERKPNNKLTDKFLEEREHQIKNDPKARRWEKSRKESWAKDKPQWRKAMMKKGLFNA